MYVDLFYYFKLIYLEKDTSVQILSLFFPFSLMMSFLLNFFYFLFLILCLSVCIKQLFDF